MIYPLLSGKLLQFAIENGTLEIVDLPNLKMVDLSQFANCKRLPEAI